MGFFVARGVRGQNASGHLGVGMERKEEYEYDFGK
jgi:hypothetical protein